jgi:tetratricopeptide (TPR) repeat protein
MGQKDSLSKKIRRPEQTEGQAIARLLAERGPLTEEEIVESLKAAGVRMDPEFDDAPEAWVEDALADGAEHLVYFLMDDRMAHLPTLLSGHRFTHRLTKDEVAFDMLALLPDLAPLIMLTERDEYHFLADGQPIEPIAGILTQQDTDARGIPPQSVPDMGWLLPAGFLAGIKATAGEFVSVEATDDGWFIEAVPVGAVTPPSVQLVAFMREFTIEHDHPVEIDAAIWQSCVDLPGSFTGLTMPIGEMLELAGLSVFQEHFARAGFDFKAEGLAGASQELSASYGLGDVEVDALLSLLDLYAAFSMEFEALVESADSPSDAFDGFDGFGQFPGARETLSQLTNPSVAESFSQEVMGVDVTGAAVLAVFTGALTEQAPRQARVALLWLQAKALERLGMIEEAEEAFSAAESLDPSWPLPLFDLARYASDRGDAERGLALLVRAGVEADDPLRETLERYSAPIRDDIGRNDRCWCGSGRKYKQCHQHREQLPIEDRAMWLYTKASVFVAEGPFRPQLIELAEIWAAHWGPNRSTVEALEDGLVLDALMFEGGAFEEFLSQRGFLLPPDEYLIAEQWLLAERSLFEIVETTPGVGMLLRDLRTGDRIEIVERTASRMVTPGNLICTRIVTVGSMMQIIGGVEPIDLRYRDALIELLDDEPDPFDLVEFLSRRFAPPTLVNTEGEDSIACEAVVRVTDAEQLLAGLDVTYEAVDTGKKPTAKSPRTWHEYVVTHGQQKIRATMRWADNELTIQTNSNPRMDRVLGVLQALCPDLVVVRDERTSLNDEFAAAIRSGGGRPTGGSESEMLDQNDPAVLAALEEYIRTYEENWLDDQIPALAGLTPREAAADPTRRQDLISLLASFDRDEEQPGMMSAKRLRAALGLTK